MPVQGCTVHKHRNLLVIRERLDQEVAAYHYDIIYAAPREEIEARWRLCGRVLRCAISKTFLMRIKAAEIPLAYVMACSDRRIAR